MSGYMQTAKTVEWATPQDLFDELDKEFHFTLDPCSTDENAKCKHHYTIDNDGLMQNWGGAKCVLQSSLWKGIGRLGGEMLHGESPGEHPRSDAYTCQNRYEVVPPVHLRQGRNPFYQGKVEVRWVRLTCSFPKYDSDI